MDKKRSNGAGRSYFGLAALAAGLATDLLLGLNYGVSQLNITPGTFDQLNNLTALLYCAFTPVTFIFGVIGHLRKNDSKLLAWTAIILAAVPLLVLVTRMIFSLAK